jgi:metal-sulfur cluster biosynthetic enzyme
MVTKEQIIKKLKNVLDPELNIDVWTLGLIYKIIIKKSDINIKMTFTFPGCPYGPWLLENVRSKISSIKGIKNVNVELTFDPPWEPSDELKGMLGI